ncbi:hypothetical protein CR513_29860, partial [Mucuna pruriens]
MGVDAYLESHNQEDEVEEVTLKLEEPYEEGCWIQVEVVANTSVSTKLEQTTKDAKVALCVDESSKIIRGSFGMKENLSPKSKVIVSYVRELWEKLEKIDRGLNSVQKDTQSVNVKVEALKKEKEERHKIAYLQESEWIVEGRTSSDRGRSLGLLKVKDVRNMKKRRGVRGKRVGRDEPRKKKLDTLKCKIPPFLGNCKPDTYIDWELEVMRLVTLEFGDYALVWWTQFLNDMKRHGIRDQCENWEALKHVMKARFVPPTYTKDLHNKLQML